MERLLSNPATGDDDVLEEEKDSHLVAPPRPSPPLSSSLYEEFVESLRRELSVGEEEEEEMGEGGEGGEEEEEEKGEEREGEEEEEEERGEGGDGAEEEEEERGEGDEESVSFGSRDVDRNKEKGAINGAAEERREEEDETDVPLELRDMDPLLQQYLQSLTCHAAPDGPTSLSVWNELHTMAGVHSGH